MKRDMEKIRSLLLQLEDCEPGVIMTPTDGDRVEAEHMALLIEAGLCEGPLERTVDGSPLVMLTRLTWSGHEFLDTIRDERTWKEAMQKVGSTVGSASLEVLSKIISEIAYKLITT